MVTALLLVALLSSSLATPPPFNASLFPLSTPPLDLSSTALPPSAPFLDAVVRALAAQERWDPQARVWISSLDDGSARVGVSQLYRFRVRVGKVVMVLKVSDDDELVDWTKVYGGVVRFGGDVVAGGGLAKKVRPALRALELVGPVELRVDASRREFDRLSLRFPTSNATYGGLKSVFVGNGITVNIEDAHEVSILHPYDIGLSLNGSLSTRGQDPCKFHSILHSSCTPILLLNIVGSASITVNDSRKGTAGVKAVLRASDTIQLLRNKCHDKKHAQIYSSCLFCSLSSNLALLDKVMRSLTGNKLVRDKPIRFTKVNITSSALVSFRMVLEKERTKNDKNWKKVPDWKEKPKTERIGLQIVAKIEKDGRLDPVEVKKLDRPYKTADSIAWSSLMSNISFTEFQSLVVSPEPLTLDVKW